MLCPKCEINMVKTKIDYRYIESGLQNVILKGISAYKCPNCKEVNPIILRIKEVHKLIAQELIKKNSLLMGKELVFLRKEMKIKAKDLAQMLGVTKVTVSRWENEKEQLSPTCDRLIRSLYENRIFKQTCEIVRPEIDKLESHVMKALLISLCQPKISLEDVFKNIKRRHVHSKISIPISNLDIPASASESNLGIEFMEEGACVQTEQTSSQLGAVGNIRFGFAYGIATAVGTPTTVGTATTVDPLTSPLGPSINRPDEPVLASAYIN